MLKEVHVDSLCCLVELISKLYLELKCASALAALVQSTMFNLVVLARQSVLLFLLNCCFTDFLHPPNISP